jgi:hypothetical protein
VKKNTGVLTALAVVLAFFGLSNLPGNSPGGAATTQTERGTKSPAEASGSAPSVYSPCKEIQKRLQPFVAGTPQQRWKLPDFCYRSPKTANDPIMKPQDMDFAIATAPNPISTHLPMLFDRVIEIIQQAAQDNNYVYDSSWLPWNEVKEYQRLSDEVAAQDA